MSNAIIKDRSDIARILEANAQQSSERLRLSQESRPSDIRELTRRILHRMNGTLTTSEKEEILAESDTTLIAWFQGPANSNEEAYASLLVLQGTCNRPSGNR